MILKFSGRLFGVHFYRSKARGRLSNLRAVGQVHAHLRNRLDLELGGDRTLEFDDVDLYQTQLRILTGQRDQKGCDALAGLAPVRMKIDDRYFVAGKQRGEVDRFAVFPNVENVRVGPVFFRRSPWKQTREEQTGHHHFDRLHALTMPQRARTANGMRKSS